MSVMGLTPLETIAIWAVFGVAILGLAYAVFLRAQILQEDKGTEKMQEVWNAIKDGADAYLRRQLRSILPLIAILTIALFFSVYIVPPSPEALERFEGTDPNTVRLWIGIARALAFVMGAGFSLTVGQIGMRMAVEGNVRVASASRRSFGDALRIAYRAGTITGMLTVCWVGRSSSSSWGSRPPMRCSASALAARSLRCSCAWAAASSPRQQTWARTLWERWKQASLRMTREILR
jgi:K(+)-stimulated pyrophosphate-energized sodium pump